MNEFKSGVSLVNSQTDIHCLVSSNFKKYIFSIGIMYVGTSTDTCVYLQV